MVMAPVTVTVHLTVMVMAMVTGASILTRKPLAVGGVGKGSKGGLSSNKKSGLKKHFLQPTLVYVYRIVNVLFYPNIKRNFIVLGRTLLIVRPTCCSVQKPHMQCLPLDTSYCLESIVQM